MTQARYIGVPEFRVHTQSGALSRALKGNLVSKTIPTYRIGFESSIAPHAPYVVQGTRVMLGRDVLWSTVTAPAVQKACMKAAIGLLGKTLRAQAAVRFDESPEGSLKLTILAMNKASVNMHDAAVQATKLMGEVALKWTKHNISLRDHTLADLARMGHPYARRHGSIQIHG